MAYAQATRDGVHAGDAVHVSTGYRRGPDAVRRGRKLLGRPLSNPSSSRTGDPRAALAAVDLSLFGFVGGWLVAVGLAQLGGAVSRYPTGEAEKRTVLELLTDVYASPVDGAWNSRAN